ncbi:MAG: quinone-dependent dihydroorotate dehydrogenase [Helicobacteraceae bacterium]|nr:quinone-dependent dihydroorotate dehydrogenase [Helicobacteraceae bacterium]
MLSYNTIKPLLFKSDPEFAHAFVESCARFSPKIPLLLPFLASKLCVKDEILRQNLCGLDFYNPIGLAAGFDKNATMIEMLCACGFSHLELGAVTPKAQAGNDKPRLWRHVEAESLQNAMGFNNDGASVISTRLDSSYPFAIPLGINIGKNKDTPLEDAISDYEILAKTFSENTDYLSINISSPNTPNLRDLQNESFIKELFLKLKDVYKKPIFLKLSPDLEIDEALKLSDCAINYGCDGIIATNTTLDYSLVSNPQDKGGISGKVLAAKSREMLKQIALHLKETKSKCILISVGGVDSAEEAFCRIKMGASLVQVYSALVFKGPSLVRDINYNLINLLKKDGFNHISEAVGASL